MKNLKSHTFSSFLNKQERKEKKNLKIFSNIAENNGMKIEKFYEERKPYIFIHSDVPLDFGGIRAYAQDQSIVFRCQDEKDTEPYGKAYKIDVENIYNDFLSEGDSVDEEEAAKQTAESMIEEVKSFFNKSKKAETEIKVRQMNEPEDQLDNYAGIANINSPAIRSTIR